MDRGQVCANVQGYSEENVMLLAGFFALGLFLLLIPDKSSTVTQRFRRDCLGMVAMMLGFYLFVSVLSTLFG